METFLSGAMFPLDLLNKWPWAFTTSQYLPFTYQMYFPAAILTGRIATGAEVGRGLVLQALWVLAAGGFARLLWARGLRRHTAVGG